MARCKGKLLLSSPALVDENFRRTVVLITEHTDEGAMGLVLNRPSHVAVGEAIPQLAELADPADAVFVGGPVQESAVVVLAEFTDPHSAADVVVGEIGLVAASAPIDGLPAAVRRARVFAGYAGWGPGQLEAELDEDSWIVAEPDLGDVFDVAPEQLWSTVLQRKGGSFALLATMPADPSMN